MYKLKECPFCNSSNVELKDIAGTLRIFYFIECDDCGCKMWGDNTEKEAIERWNLRYITEEKKVIL